MQGTVYNFNYGWHFRLADAFPLRGALEATRDAEGRFFYETDYQEAGCPEAEGQRTGCQEDCWETASRWTDSQEEGQGIGCQEECRKADCRQGWKEVGLPHTFNDEDLFLDRIQDAGSGQKRTFSCYRKWFDVPEGTEDGKFFLEFEGVRQTCYLYVNGRLAGYCEAGVAPFGFDLTPYMNRGGRNLIAVATDNTASRNLDYFAAETPNHPDAVPGEFVASLTEKEPLPGTRRGVPYFWNCNDFNPSVGGLSRNVRLHVKPGLYLTLPLYSNLRTRGVYLYGSDFEIPEGRAVVHGEAQVKNETGQDCRAALEILILEEGRTVGRILTEETTVRAASEEDCRPVLTVVPEDAYVKKGEEFEPVPEEEARPTCTESPGTVLLQGEAKIEGLRFWHPDAPHLYQVQVRLLCDGQVIDQTEIVTGFRKVEYIGGKGLFVNDSQVWLTGYAQRAANEWAAMGTVPDWLKDADAGWIRESNANHVRFMHVAGSPADIRSFDRYGVVCTQPAGDKERESFGRQWNQRMELMRDVILYFRNSPSVFFWEAGNNSVGKEHMRQMRLLKQELDPKGGRFMGCRTINTEEVVEEAEYVGTMLNRHAAPFIASRVPITETEYLREESPRRVWDDFTPPDYDYDNLWLGKMGRKAPGGDCYDLTAEEFALCAAKGYEEFFHDRIGGASGRNLYCATAALCWTDSAQHGRQAYSENARMSGRVDPVRVKKQSFRMFQVMQSPVPRICILGHWNYPPEGEGAYRYALKELRDGAWRKTGEYGYRDPKDKTVYVAGSYGIARVELFVNGEAAGVCEKPIHTFVFAFPHIDITRSGVIEARAYDYGGAMVARHRLETAGEPCRIRLSLHTGDEGFWADGVDIAYLDVEVTDAEGRICPLCDKKISFSVSGEAVFLGGYNSGRFRGFGRDDSVIHQSHVYAECGINRVFLRSTGTAGAVRVRADMEGVPETEVEFVSLPKDTGGLSGLVPQRLAPKGFGTGNLTSRQPAAQCADPRQSAFRGSALRHPDSECSASEYTAPCPEDENAGHCAYPFGAIPEADAAKFVPADKLYCKVLVNGQEPNTYGILSVVDHESVYSPVLYILEAMHRSRPEAFDYSFEDGFLRLRSGGRQVTAEVGRTHLLVDGEENLMNGQPYLNGDGALIVEINAVITYIAGVRAFYDPKANVFRIEW